MKHSSLRRAAVAGLLFGLCGPISGDSTVRAVGETFKSPVRGEEWRAVRDETTGRKWFESASGERADTPAEIALREWRTLPPLQQVVEPSLADAATDPGRAAETADVTILFRRQPAHDAGMAARAKYAPRLAPHLALAREIVSRLDLRRLDRAVVDPAEDDRLLTAEEKSQVRAAQADVETLAAQMRREVAQRASAEAAADQAGVRAWLAQRSGVTVLGSSWILSTISARVPLGDVVRLVETFPEIARVTRCRVCEPALDVSVPTVSAGTWWNAGYYGSSTTAIAVVDTGIDSGHPALTVSNGAVFLTAAANMPGFSDNASSTDDLHGHGTHVGGIAASSDPTYMGVAPGVHLLNAKCGYLQTGGRGSFQEADIFGAGDWAATSGAVTMNCSFGGGAMPNDGSGNLALFFDAAVFALSVDVAVASGNTGASVLTPGDAFNVVTVGNVDDQGTTSWSDNSLAGSSSRGPTYDGRRKPDLSAPGTDITSCSATWEGSANDWVAYTGTSMASPHTAGSLALLRSYSVSWAPEALKALLLTSSRNTSPAPTTPDDDWGWGALDIGAAYANRASVLEGTFSSTTTSEQLVRLGSLAAGGRVTLVWNRHVLSNGASAPVTSYALMDADLYVYDGSTGSQAASSTSAVNPVEQVQLTSALSDPIVRVSLTGQLPSGVTTEPFALAAESSTSSAFVEPPVLECSIAALPSPVGPGQSFDLPVTVTNSGDVLALAPVVTLTLPTGWSSVESSAGITLSNVAVGGSATATFHVTTQSSGPSGQKTVYTRADAVSFGVASTGSAAATQTLDADAPNATVSVNSGDAYTGTANVTLTVSATDAVSGIGTMRFRNAGGAWSDWEAFATTKSWTLASGDGSRTVEAEVRDTSGNAAPVSDAISLDTTAPSGSVILNGGAPYASAATVSLATSATDALSGVTEQRISSDGVNFGAWQAYGTTSTVTLPGVEGTTTRWAQFRDAVGNVSATVSSSVVRDITAPTGTLSVNGGASFTNQVWASVATSAADALSGVVEMRIGTNGNAWSGWFAYTTHVDLELPNPESLNTVYVQYRDAAGNSSELYSAAIVLDATTPSGSMTIENGAEFTAAATVTLSLTASDVLSGIASVRLRNEDDEWGAWQTYSATAPWTLPAGEGAKTVHAQFRDGAGNVSGEVLAVITRDLTPPDAAFTIEGGAAAVNRTGVELQLDATDARSGVADVRVAADGAAWLDWTPAGETFAFTLPDGEGPRTVWVQFRDAVGNVSEAVSRTILLDVTAPSGSFVLNGGTPRVLPWETLVADAAADDGPGGSGVSTVEFSVDAGATWSAPQDAALTAVVGREGIATDESADVLARFRDAAGNVSASAVARTYLVPAPVQGVDSAKTFAGTFAPGGDVDAFTIEVLEGDVLSVRSAARSAKKGGSLVAELDLYGPSHEKLLEGRWPASSKKPGIAKFRAPATGTYVVVVRAAGADAALGGAYTLTESVVRPKANSRIRGKAGHDPSGGRADVATAAFDGALGAVVTGTVAVAGPTELSLVAPDGTVAELVAKPRRGVARVSFALAGGTGSYTLRAVTYGFVPYVLTLVPARRSARASELVAPGTR